jgi:chemotaxis protein methyltransferase WspC
MSAVLTPEQLAIVEQLLRQQIGLQPDTVGRDRIVLAVGDRLARRGQDVSAYLELLRGSAEEMHALVDVVVVPETWFFRDRQAFRCLRRQVREGSPAGKFRALSVPCCTGEEPYSIAIIALDAGQAASDFEVVGVDVSPAALATAASGVYTDLSFRETMPEFAALRDRYCRREGNTYTVAEDVRNAVRFHQANLAGPEFLADEPPFDAIFCRNLFIYLDAPAQQTALANLHRLLLPDGALYFSAVEAGALVNSGFRPRGEEFPFVFGHRALNKKPVKASVSFHASQPSRGPTQAPTVRGGLPKRDRVSRSGLDGGATSRKPTALSAAEDDEIAAVLAKAREAADAGRLDEGAALCAAMAAKGPPRADVCCLLGVVRQAQGDFADAERWFHRALYLDPRQAEALVHMALLARRRGDERLAENFLRRASRAASGKD